MAGFQTHITVSTATGAVYGWLGATQLGLPFEQAAVGAGLCAISGMLPDLDSDSGVPARETVGFAAAVLPMLLMKRFFAYGVSLDQYFLFGVPVYLFVRFGLGTLLQRFTVHRGMFHSLPAALIAGLLAYLVVDTGWNVARLYKAFAVTLGYLSHLVLDEIWSVEVGLLNARLKKSFGSALKLFGNDAASNSLCYGLLLLIGMGVIKESPPASWTAWPNIALTSQDEQRARTGSVPILAGTNGAMLPGVNAGNPYEADTGASVLPTVPEVREWNPSPAARPRANASFGPGHIGPGQIGSGVPNAPRRATGTAPARSARQRPRPMQPIIDELSGADPASFRR